MSARWLNSLVKARKFAEDNARQRLSTAERLASRAHARVRYDADRLDDLQAADAQANADAFVAAAVALQAAAATHAAATHAADRADREAARKRSDLTHAAVARRGAEELQQRAAAAELARRALLAQRGQDEVAAGVHRRTHLGPDIDEGTTR